MSYLNNIKVDISGNFFFLILDFSLEKPICNLNMALETTQAHSWIWKSKPMKIRAIVNSLNAQKKKYMRRSSSLLIPQQIFSSLLFFFTKIFHVFAVVGHLICDCTDIHSSVKTKCHNLAIDK